MTTRTLGKYSKRSFTLEHPDYHVLLLLHEGELVAPFSEQGATRESLQDECMRHLVFEHHWNGS